MLTNEKRRHIAEEAASLLSKGMSDLQVHRHLVTSQGITIETARRYVKAAHAEFARRLRKDRPRLIATQSAKLDTAQRTAMAAVHHYADKGVVVTTVPEPDVGAFVGAITAQNRLLGLNAPERREIILATVNGVVGDLVSLIMRHLPEAKRRIFMHDLDEIIEKRVAGSRMGIEAPPDSASSHPSYPSSNLGNGGASPNGGSGAS